MRKKLNVLKTLFIICSFLIFISCEEKSDKSSSSLCQVSVLDNRSFPYFKEFPKIQIERTFDEKTHDKIRKHLRKTFNTIHFQSLKMYLINDIIFFTAKIIVDCGEVFICGVYDDGLIKTKNLGNFNYIDLLFYEINENSLSSVYGEMKVEDTFYQCCITYLKPEGKIIFEYVEGGNETNSARFGNF